MNNKEEIQTPTVEIPNFKRNEKGLLENVSYVFNKDGSINWKAMIKPEFLVVQKNYEKDVVEKFGKDLRDIDLREVDDKYLLILLGGIKDLLRLRGFTRVHQHVDFASHGKCVVTCTIHFIPNFETGGQEMIFSDVGSASHESTSDIFQLFIEPIAANRAFVRCVRNALGINIAGKDEFDEKANKEYKNKSSNTELDVKPDSASFSPNGILATLCLSLNISFEKLREHAIKIASELSEDPSKWTAFSSIQNVDAFTLINKIQSAQKKKVTK